VFSETDGATQALYLASGHLLYDQPEGILVSAFELDSLAKKGSPASPLPDAHSFQGAGGLSYVAASAPGDVVFLPASATRTIASLRSLSERGDWSELSSQEHQYESIALDPEGRRIALGIAGSDGGAGIWVYDIARSSLTPLVRDGGNNTSPVWTPDGRRLTFTSGRRGRPPNLFAVPSDGSAVEERVFESGEPAFPVSWSPDGSVLAFISRDQISILRKDGRIEPFLPGPASAARFSPDGHWLAYVSAESGRDEVYVTSYPVASPDLDGRRRPSGLVTRRATPLFPQRKEHLASVDRSRGARRSGPPRARGRCGCDRLRPDARRAHRRHPAGRLPRMGPPPRRARLDGRA